MTTIQLVCFIVSTFSIFIIAATMLARANDLRWRKQLRWNVRLLGFIFTGCAPIGIVGTEWMTKDFPSPYEAIFRFGLMLVFMTTPYLPPWHKWMWRGTEDKWSPQ